ncbi:hypothetical protein DL89DRAFT_268221 [Linderina pennispora]|uniref:Uncharacterized protein n=1 Tax=Linderina pennispora TaxID=61395 RepID=A0A1Y1W6N5_9FUNG|nr:uncharacterized protein DL89DRAFT_268221 [Linderina pennispora]ORX69210.1 hypothetical protein DL89DRAFT_268221 [Linderina pennispora]
MQAIPKERLNRGAWVPRAWKGNARDMIYMRTSVLGADHLAALVTFLAMGILFWLGERGNLLWMGACGGRTSRKGLDKPHYMQWLPRSLLVLACKGTEAYVDMRGCIRLSFCCKHPANNVL